MIRWLHISDLHFNNHDMSTCMLREELLRFLVDRGFRCDYIFCTGDIRTANAKTNDFTDEAAAFLKALCISVGVSVDRLFIVPGNHDVDRDSQGREEAVHRVSFRRKGYYDPRYGSIEEGDIRTIHEGQKEFREFLGKIYDSNRLRYYDDPEKPHFNIQTEDFNVLHVDTTVTYTEDQESMDLIIGTRLLQNALNTLNRDKPTILLTHYPFTALMQDEKKHVSELLYRKGVRLWLAGHEHDHMLQTIRHLDSIQAGELRMEDRSSATVLIGEYEPMAYRGTISAYTWFPEGWAKYPIICHGGNREDEYSFSLQCPRGSGLSFEVLKADAANQEFYGRLPETIIKEIFPELIIEKEAYTGGLSALLQESWHTLTPHIILKADGGMGKTTMLLSACREKNEAMLYISAERLEAIGIGIEEYCARILFGGDGKAFRKFAGVKYEAPNLILFIDGLNEVAASSERSFINEIKGLNLLQGIQVVITSRSDFTARYSMSGYRLGELRPLQDKQIESLFSSEEWSYIKDSVTLHRLLTNPMMVTMYKEICPIIAQFSHEEFLEWTLPIKNATDLLHNYYVAQIAVVMQRASADGGKTILTAQCVSDILPALGYAFEVSHSLNISNGDFRKTLADIVSGVKINEAALAPLQERLRVYDIQAPTAGEVFDLLINDLHLVYRDGAFTSFPHQIYRDYLSACWIVKESENAGRIEEFWNARALPFPVMEHIRNLGGEYWNGIAERIHKVGKGKADMRNLTGNLLDCFPYTQNSGCPDYSELDLRGLQIPDSRISEPRISMKNTLIDRISIGKSSGRPLHYTHLKFSEDNEYLAASASGKIIIFSLLRDQSTFLYSIGQEVKRFVFAGRYLFAAIREANAGILVFTCRDEWAYTGCINSKDGGYGRLWNKRLRSIILHDENLYFYYNNREVRYRLSDCQRIYNKQKQHMWEHTIDGTNLTIMKQNEGRTKDKSNGVIWKEAHKGLTAVSTVDGGLIVTSGTEIQYVLARGVTLLKDGAIAGDGTKAATLSYDLFADKRKIQIWNLDEKRKTGEIYCPSEIEKIHMSELGEWILGETASSTWIYHIGTGENQWFSEHFISNQRGKLATYGSKVLRKNDENRLYLYDLGSGMIEEVENSCENARLACFMSDGSIAAVGDNAYKVRLKNIRKGTFMEVNSQPAIVIGLQALKNQPFIAVATKDNVISIYHIGDGLRKRILKTNAGNYMMVVHPEYSVIANSNGLKKLETYNYYEKEVNEKKMGWWYNNPYDKADPPILGDVLDLAFNTMIHELVVILSSGQIIYCHEKYCRYHGTTEIITNFNVDAYDFYGCVCDEDIKAQLLQNGTRVEHGLPGGQLS